MLVFVITLVKVVCSLKKNASLYFSCDKNHGKDVTDTVPTRKGIQESKRDDDGCKFNLHI